MSEAGASLDAAKGKAAEDAGSQQAEEVDVVLVRFKVKECYLYSVPPASSIGHRAETWGVEKWDKVTTVGDKCYVRLFDPESGELFAECPLPLDPKIFHTAVEPVIDSSRYFVLKIVDAESNRHAFVGIGFRDRGQASDFNAALDDHRSYLRRKSEAAKLTQAYENEKANEAGETGGSGKDLSIKGTIHINMNKLDVNKKRKEGERNFLDRMQNFQAVDPNLSPLLSLPPPPAPPAKAEQVSHASSGGFWRAFDEGGRGDTLRAESTGVEPSETSRAEEDDGWGDFQDT